MRVNTLRFLFPFLALISIFFAREETDYERASRSYEKGDKVFARMYFENVLGNPDYRQYYPDAVYYLTKIHSEKNEELPFLSYACRFLADYPYDMRASEIFGLLLQDLVGEKAYVIAADYVREYEYLAGGDSLLVKLGYGLVELDEKDLADYVFSLCPQIDTIKIARAFLNKNYEEREKIFRTLGVSSRDLYLTENYLMMGDTVRAFLKFHGIDDHDLGIDGLYRLAKIALLFDRDGVRGYAGDLAKHKQYTRKAALLTATIDCNRNAKFQLSDDEETTLYVKICMSDTVSKEPPGDLSLDSLLRETDDTLGTVRGLTRKYKGNYYIDSLYCHLLTKEGRYSDAARCISEYLNYCNTQAYARKVVGFQYYMDKEYGNAATNIILSNHHSPPVLYVLAECLRSLEYDAGFLYKQVMTATEDSSLYFRALTGYIKDRNRVGDYQALCALDIGSLQGDTNLIRIYVQSLARCGSRQLADSLHSAYFGDKDPVLLNLHGLYMIEHEKYSQAQAYYDSIVQIDQGNDEILYNWALTSFLNNDMETARQRFSSYVAGHPAGTRLHDAFFKIATLNYLGENYDSAAYYYGLASVDSTLAMSGLRNQLLCYKKAGDWLGVISTGQRLLVLTDKAEEADVLFDIGYAFLRAGRVKEALENLNCAARLKSDPRFYYWLGEAYLGKGDFARSFYSYRKVIDLYGDDEMWAPTAQYKTGIVLELMDEIDAARAVYQALVNKKGVADPIGAEANIRLQQLAP
jgi:TolA-binding protein